MSILAVVCESVGAVTVVFYLFLIGIIVYYRKDDFNTSFYKLFISLAISDVLQRIVSQLVDFFPYDGVLSSVYASDFGGFIAVFGQFLNHFAGYAESFGHVLLALNRFTAMKYPIGYEAVHISYCDIYN